MKRGMTFEYLKCRADLNFEVDFGVNGAIGAIVTKWDLILFYNGLFSSIKKIEYALCPFNQLCIIDISPRLQKASLFDNSSISIENIFDDNVPP